MLQFFFSFLFEFFLRCSSFPSSLYIPFFVMLSRKAYSTRTTTAKAIRTHCRPTTAPSVSLLPNSTTMQQTIFCILPKSSIGVDDVVSVQGGIWLYSEIFACVQDKLWFLAVFLLLFLMHEMMYVIWHKSQNGLGRYMCWRAMIDIIKNNARISCGELGRLMSISLAHRMKNSNKKLTHVRWK